MVATSCALLIFIALENVEARKDFQVLKENFFLLLSLMCLGEFALSLVWVKTQAGTWSSVVFVRSRAFNPWQWNTCFRGSPAAPPAERGLLTGPQDRGGTQAPQDQCGASADLGFGSCSVHAMGVSLSCRFGLGGLSWVLSQVLVTSLVFSCCRFCCQLCSFELVLSVLYFTPKLVFLWISWCGEEVLVTSQLIPFCLVCPALQHCLFLLFVLYASVKNSVPKQLWRLISLHCALLRHPLFFRGCDINISAYLLGLLLFF